MGNSRQGEGGQTWLAIWSTLTCQACELSQKALNFTTFISYIWRFPNPVRVEKPFVHWIVKLSYQVRLMKSSSSRSGEAGLIVDFTDWGHEAIKLNQILTSIISVVTRQYLFLLKDQYLSNIFSLWYTGLPLMLAASRCYLVYKVVWRNRFWYQRENKLNYELNSQQSSDQWVSCIDVFL